jgi:anti-sigma regulatory factor (Ser/Thr protein kinase)
VIAGLAVRETVTLAGRAERARVARALLAAVLGPGYPSTDVAVLLVSEIFGNSVRHSRSGDPGEMITVAVKVTGSAVRVEVTDLRGPGVPELVPTGGDEEGGRGLQLVAGLATRWRWRRRGERTVTWFGASVRLIPPVARYARPRHPWVLCIAREALTGPGAGSHSRNVQAMASSCQGGPT